MKAIERAVKEKVILLDGATGTELQRQGLPQGICPEIWCIENEQMLYDTHSAYKKSGSEVIYTFTFGGNRPKLRQYGANDVFDINRKLARIARKAAGTDVMVAGDIGPTGKFIQPFGPLAFDEAVDLFKEQIKGLIAGGVDILVIETMFDIQEARAALIAAKEISDKFVMVTMTFEDNGLTLGGTDPVSALITLQSLGADAVGCNCSLGPRGIIDFIKRMKPYATVPLVAKPNAGLPSVSEGKTVFSMDDIVFASFAKELVASGVNMLGGCCGTTPKHIKRLRQKIKSMSPEPPRRKSLSALSSAKKSVIIDDNSHSLLIGECINPTGKKNLGKELNSGKISLVRRLAKEQQRAGADFLDVNVGVAVIKNKEILKKAVEDLSVTTDLPLVIDCSDPQALEKALRVYPGRALINSISGSQKDSLPLLDLARRYGAMFILLPLTSRSVPKDSKERISVIKEIYSRLKKQGFSKKDFIVDALALSLATYPDSFRQTLDSISWCKERFKVNTVIGLSNVSFGLPDRESLNAACLVLARDRGLNLAIANPFSRIVMDMDEAVTVLKNPYKATKSSKHKRGVSLGTAFESSHGGQKPPSLEKRIYIAVLEGQRDETEEHIKSALKQRISPYHLIDKVIIPAINEVGDKFEKKEYFLPQLISSAESAKRAFEKLKPHIKMKKKDRNSRIVVVLATVKGDIHDIGKNIVSLILQNHGFDVIDLGKDVSAQRIIKEARKHKNPIIGLSALMTTTMVNIKEVVSKARQQGIACTFLIGGAVVNKPFASSLGARYANDGVEAVKIIKQIYSGKE